MDNKRIIEINGIKLEIDLTKAKKINEYRVGDKIKVLIKNYSDYKSFAGVIVGFDNFEKLPTIIIAYLEYGYSQTDVKFVYFNEKTENTEICLAHPDDIPLEQSSIIAVMDSNIEKLRREYQELIEKKDRFIRLFSKYFEE